MASRGREKWRELRTPALGSRPLHVRSDPPRSNHAPPQKLLEEHSHFFNPWLSLTNEIRERSRENNEGGQVGEVDAACSDAGDGVGGRRSGRGEVANTGDAQNSLGIVSYGPAGDDVGAGNEISVEDVCRDRVIERLAGELGISEEEAEELLDLVREFADAEEFDALFGELCER